MKTIMRSRQALFSGMRRVKRLFDQRPIAAHIYVTEKCNLRCSYCTEVNNRVPHPKLKTLKMWIDKLEELGVLRIGLQGGEPLLHPDIVEVVRYVKSKNLGCSMSSNALLLTPELVRGLENAGLDAFHVSIDKLTPDKDTRKCVELAGPKVEYLKGSRIPLHVTGVLYGGSLGDLPGVFEFARSLGVSIKAHLVHSGVEGVFTVEPGDKEKLESFIDWEIDQKRRGRDIRTMFNILKYQKGLLSRSNPDWTCLAGYKYFFVSAKGEFCLCSMKREPGVDIMTVTPEMLASNNKKKACQEGCGVYCIVAESLVNNHPLRFAGREILGYMSGIPSRLRGFGPT